jgi:polysaccharide biosynthesis protein VpsQ
VRHPVDSVERTRSRTLGRTLRSTRTWRLIALGFFLFLLFVAACADMARLPWLFRAICDYPGGDKVGHFGLYGMFAFLGAKGWPRPLRWGRLACPVGVVPAALLATLEEASQLWLAGRSAEWLDLLAGFLGIGLGGLLATRTVLQRL